MSIALAGAGALAYRPVVEFLLSAHELRPDREVLDSALRRASAQPAGGLEAAIRRLAADVGLLTAVVRRPLAEVLDDADPAYPWVALREGADGRPEAIAVLRRTRGGALVATPGADARPGRWSLASLRRWLGVSSDAEVVTWLLAEPAAPLSALRSPDHEELAPFARIRALLRGERRTLWVAVIYSVVIGVLTLVVPIAVQSVVNTLAFGTAFQPLVVLMLFVLVALAFSTLLNAVRAAVVEVIQRSIFARVSTDVTWRLLRVRADAFDRYYGPELVNRFFDTVTVQKSAALLLIDGLSIVMQTVIGMVLVALYHPYLLVFDILIIVAMLGIVFILGRGAVATSIKESKAKYALEAWLEQIAANLVTFKTAGAADHAVQRSHRLLEDYLTYRAKHFSILIRQIVGSFALQAVASAALLGIGGWLVIQRQLTLGQLVASELIVAAMMSAFTKFGKQLEVFYDLSAAIDKLGTLIDLPLERAGGEASLPASGPMGLSVRDVSVRYDGGGAASHVRFPSFDLRAGERLGVTGPTGAGKSTLVDVIFGLRVPATGTVIVDGVDLRAVPLEQLRGQIAVVRGVELFPGSILDNVRLGRAHVSYENVVEALRAVGLLDDLVALPDGLDTELQPHGRPLSNRQSALLMVARAIVGTPRLLIADGVLDHVDGHGQRSALADVLLAAGRPWSLLCISDRTEVLARCDRVLTLDDASSAREAE